MAGYYGKKDEVNVEYERLLRDLKAGTPCGAYFFYGEERYLLEDAVRKLREMIPEGTAEFNHHRMEGKSFSVDALLEAVDALPVFAERTLVEVRDVDFAKQGDDVRRAVMDVLRDVPEYTTIVFIAPDGSSPEWKTKSAKELAELLIRVEFRKLNEKQAENWVARNLAAAGKRITRDGVSRFVKLTGGLMTNMKTETEKLIAYTKGDAVDLRDVELLVTPVADARTWMFTDAVIGRRPDEAFLRMGELLSMPGTDAYSVIYALVTVTRQLMIAIVCVEKGIGQGEFMALASVKYWSAGKSLMAAARRIPLERASKAAKLCCETILRLNSTSENPLGAAEELTGRVLLALGVRA